MNTSGILNSVDLLISNVLKIEGIFDYIVSLQDVINICQTLPVNRKNTIYDIKWNQKFIKKFHNIRLEIGKESIIMYFGANDIFIFEYYMDDFEFFLKLFGDSIKTIKCVKKLDELVYNINDGLLNYSDYDEFYFSYVKSCHDICVMFIKYCANAQTDLEQAGISPIDHSFSKYFLIDNVFQYLEQNTILQLINIFKPIIFQNLNVFKSFLIINIKDCSSTFEKIVLHFQKSLFPTVTNRNNLKIENLFWNGLIIFLTCVGFHIKQMEICSENEEQYKDFMNNFSSLIEIVCPNLEHMIININKKAIDINMIQKKYPFLKTIKVTSIHNYSMLTKKIELDFGHYLIEQEHTLKNLDISFYYSQSIQSHHFKLILTLPNLIYLKMLSSYSSVDRPWNFLSGIKLKSGSSILPSLISFTIICKVNESRNDIEEFFIQTNELMAINKIKKCKINILEILNYNFNEFFSNENYEFNIHFNTIIFSNCYFEDEIGSNNILKMFKYCTAIYFKGRTVHEHLIYSMLGELRSLKFDDCDNFGTSEQFLNLLQNVPQIKVSI